MEDTTTKALGKLKEALSGKSLEEIATLTGFRKEKLFQWEKIGKFPSMKVAKKVLRAL